MLLELGGGTEAGPPRRRRDEGLKRRGRSDTGMVGGGIGVHVTKSPESL